MSVNVKPPVGGEFVEIPPKTSAINKLVACLQALGMNVVHGAMGGGGHSVLGYRGDIKLAIEVHYEMGISPTGRASSSFEHAKVYDPIGLIVNLEADYSIGAARRKELGLTEDQALARGNRLSATYNDGAQYNINTTMFHTAGAMNEWLDDWLGVLKIDHKRQSPVKKAKPTDLDLMMGAEWTG